MTGRPTILRRVTREFLAQTRLAIEEVFPPPARPWYVRGPRGGVYRAVGEVQRLRGEDMDDVLQNTITIGYRADGAKYLRPGTREHRAAQEVPA